MIDVNEVAARQPPFAQFLGRQGGSQGFMGSTVSAVSGAVGAEAPEALNYGRAPLNTASRWGT
jgi:hypothetical protein